MKTKVVSADLKILNQLIFETFGHQALNYGEGHEIVVQDQGANYQSISLQKPCAVDDNYDLVFFLVRENAEPTDQINGGYRNSLSRKTRFKLIGNSKDQNAEFNLSVLINQVPGIEYFGSSFDGKNIARQFFGEEDHNFETYFFTIDFSVVEKIECVKC